MKTPILRVAKVPTHRWYVNFTLFLVKLTQPVGSKLSNIYTVK